MKPFSFKLEPLLFKRQTEEEICGGKLLCERKKLDEMQIILKDIHLQYQDSIKRLNGGSINIAELESNNRWANRLLVQLEQARVVVRTQMKAVDKLRQEMLGLHQDKRVVEVLKDKQQKAFVKHHEKLEAKEADEMSIQRFARASTE